MIHMIGADPEVFLRNAAGFFPSTGLLGGTKQNPFSFADGFAVQEDNVTAEYNIPPATSKEDWTKYHKIAWDYLQERVGNDVELVAQSAAEFDSSWFERIPQLMESGCDADFSVYTFESSAPQGSLDNKTRFAGGHVHVSCDYDWDGIQSLVRWLDLLIAVPFVRMDSDNRRRLLYGQAGVFRMKPYGIEYRTPSSVWTRYPKWQAYVYEAAQLACKILDDKENVSLPSDEMLLDAVNKRNLATIRSLFNQYKPLYLEVVHNVRN